MGTPQDFMHERVKLIFENSDGNGIWPVQNSIIETLMKDVRYVQSNNIGSICLLGLTKQ